MITKLQTLNTFSHVQRRPLISNYPSIETVKIHFHTNQLYSNKTQTVPNLSSKKLCKYCSEMSVRRSKIILGKKHFEGHFFWRRASLYMYPV